MDQIIINFILFFIMEIERIKNCVNIIKLNKMSSKEDIYLKSTVAFNSEHELPQPQAIINLNPNQTLDSSKKR